MNDEKTIFDNEKTQYQSQQQENSNTPKETTETVESKREPNKKPMWKRAAIGAGTGFAAGVATTVLTSSTPAHPQNDGGNEEPGQVEHPEWVDGEVPVAHNVNDNMSFGEAFEAARTEVGAGGVFEWHGNIYNTYYEDEWAGMSAADRAEFGSHFSWNEHQHNDVAATHHQTHHNEVTATVVDNPEDEVLVTYVDDESVEEDSNVEILGVVHDEESGANIGGLTIGGHDAVVLDVDGDMTFDLLGIDTSGNHEFELEEIHDISEEGLTVDDLGGLPEESSVEQTSDEIIPDSGTYEC